MVVAVYPWLRHPSLRIGQPTWMRTGPKDTQFVNKSGYARTVTASQPPSCNGWQASTVLSMLRTANFASRFPFHSLPPSLSQRRDDYVRRLCGGETYPSCPALVLPGMV